MRQQQLSLLVLLVAVLGVVGCANPAGDKPEAEVGEATADAAPASGGARYVLSETSTIGFTGSKVTGSHEGGFNAFSGEIMVVGDDPTQSSVNVDIDTTSLWSDADKLTEHLKSADFFDTATYPQATFSSTAIAAAETGYSVTGNLDLHGVTKSITFPAEITVAEGEVKARAEFFIQRFDFGIEYKGRADDLIRDEVVIKLDLVATTEG
jgi:polyisoprenoid-binding protein YceI